MSLALLLVPHCQVKSRTKAKGESKPANDQQRQHENDEIAASEHGSGIQEPDEQGHEQDRQREPQERIRHAFVRLQMPEVRDGMRRF